VAVARREGLGLKGRKREIDTEREREIGGEVSIRV